MHCKERTANCKLGMYNDSLFYAASGTYTGSNTRWRAEEFINTFHTNAKLRTTPRFVTSQIGREQFCSTPYHKPRYNSCLHTVDRAVNLPYAYWCQDWNPYYWLTYGYHAPFQRDDSPNVTLLGVPAVLEVSDFVRARAWWSMQPRFISETQVLNTLFELKDFRDIAKTLIRPGRIVDGFNNFVRNVIHKKVWPKKVYDPSKPAAEAWLTYHYAYIPTIKDLAGIAASLIYTAKEAQSKFKGMGDMIQKSHYTEQYYEKSTLVAGSYNNYWRAFGHYTSASFTATMQYTYKYVDRSTLDAFAHYWGLTGTIEAFWNMIPFSFIADYFAKIGKALHMMTVDKNVDLKLAQYTESTLIKHTYGNHTSANTSRLALVLDGEYSCGPNQLISGNIGSRYERKICEPYKGPALPKLKLPSSTQGLNMLALARCFF